MNAAKGWLQRKSTMAAAAPTQIAHVPPFDVDAAIYSHPTPLPRGQLETRWPPQYHRRSSISQKIRLERITLGQQASIRQYLSNEVDVSRLNKIHEHLWLAGLPRLARPLHEQILKGRRIVT